jgi:hypothetical protein
MAPPGPAVTATTALRAPATAGARSRWRQLAITLAPLLVLILLCVILGLINPNFFGVRNLSRIATQSAIPLVLGIGLTFVIVMGSIDLSIEGLVSLTAVVLSLLVLNGLNANDWGFLGVLAVLAVATAAGLLNGALHVGLKIPSFMATLGMWFVGVGAANAVLGGEQVRINDEMVRGCGWRWPCWRWPGSSSGTRASAATSSPSAAARTWRSCRGSTSRACASSSSAWQVCSTASAASSPPRSRAPASRRSARAGCSRP